mgnify:CR=1 FL=1
MIDSHSTDALARTLCDYMLLRHELVPSDLILVLGSNDLRVAAQLCDSVIVMHQGRIVEQGRTAELYGSPQHDYTRMLFQAAPGAGASHASQAEGAPT